MDAPKEKENNTKNIFISYSRKDALDVADFRGSSKDRDFEILIDDEEITFNKPWKANIRKKISDSNGAVLFLSNNALNPESPIRTLEIPLIAKRFSDPEDEFYFFPILLDDLDEELFADYSFIPLGSDEPVNFLEYFQLYDLQSDATLKNLSVRKRKREYQILNADISNALEGGTKSPGRKRLKRARQRKSILSGLALGVLILGSILFSNTEAFANLRLQTVVYLSSTYGPAADSSEEESGISRFFEDQIDQAIEDGAIVDEEVLQKIEEINPDLNIQLTPLPSNENLSSGLENTEQSTTTTVAPVLTTTTTSISGQTTTTTTPVTTTTLANSSSDVASPTFTQALTASNITTDEVDLNWSASDNTGISYYVLKEGSSEIYRGSNTTKELEGLVSGNNYTLTVYAYDAAGNSNTSSVSFTTLGSSTSTTTTSTTTTSTTTIPLTGLCSSENYLQYENLPSDTEVLVVWYRVDENCNQNSGAFRRESISILL